MNVIIQSPGFKTSAELEALVNDKLQKLEPLAHNVIRADVTLYKVSEGNPENCYCEIRLEIPGNDPFVKKHAAGFEQSITEAVDALHHILHKHKEKRDDQRQAGDRDAIADVLEATEDADVPEELL